MERDRQGLDSNVLRFVARMDTTRPIDMDRRFVIFFHLSDDTVTVFEPPQRNSGAYYERGPLNISSISTTHTQTQYTINSINQVLNQL